MNLKTLNALVLLGCSHALCAYGAGEATGNVLYAEHFAQVLVTFDNQGVCGPALQSSLNACRSAINNMTSDSNGNFYFVSVSNNKIYWMNPAGAITPIAGSGTCGFRDGPGDEACFAMGSGMYASTQIHCDDNFGVYVADNNRIRKIYRVADGTWQVSTVVGGGKGSPTKNAWIAADKISVGSRFFALSQDKKEIYFCAYSGLVKVLLKGNAAGENAATEVITLAEMKASSPFFAKWGMFYMWKSAAYMTDDGQLYWMPNDPNNIVHYGTKTGIFEPYTSGLKSGAARNRDETSRTNAGFQTVLVAVSPSGKTMFTAGGDEAVIRRIHEDTIKHLLLDGTFRQQNTDKGGWCGAAQYVDRNGFFYSMGGAWGNGASDINVKLTFEGSDTSGGKK